MTNKNSPNKLLHNSTGQAKIILHFTLSFFILIFAFCVGDGAAAAQIPSFYLAPSQGTFLTGSTFSISIYADTKGNEINALELDLTFPADILQVTAPTAGDSFILDWTAPPSYSNSAGFISFKGGIPGGIVTSAGLVSTITFRARSPGEVKIKISDSSRVFLNDGKGTAMNTKNINGAYEISISPPDGPAITSSSHPDSEIWYADSYPIFSWEGNETVTDISYVFSQNSQEVPDTVPEDTRTTVSYNDVADGVWYFHIRERKKDIWGKPSHFAVKIDNTPPKSFTPSIDTSVNFLYFNTEDSHSGINYYEVSLSNNNEPLSSVPFFVETGSPYKLPLTKSGNYNIIVHAYDKAGNRRDAEIRYQIIAPSVSIIEGRGVQISGTIFPWKFIYIISALLFLGAIYLMFSLIRRKRGFRKGIKEIKEALDEIKKIEDREKDVRMIKERFEAEKKKLEEKLK